VMEDRTLQTQSGLNDRDGNLDIRRFDMAKTYLRAQESEYNELQRKDGEKKRDAVVDLILDGKYKQAHEAIRSEGFPKQHAEGLENWIKERSKPTEPSEQQSLGEYARLQSAIFAADDPRTVVSEIIKAGAAGKIRGSEGRELINQANTAYSQIEKDGLKQATDDLHAALGPSGTAEMRLAQLEAQSPDDLTPVDQALMDQTRKRKGIEGEARAALANYVLEHKRLHAAGKEDALSPQDIRGFANTLISLRTEPLDKQVEDLKKIEAASEMAYQSRQAPQVTQRTGVHIKSSDGTEHWVTDVEKAKKIDPKLTVIQ